MQSAMLIAHKQMTDEDRRKTKSKFEVIEHFLIFESETFVGRIPGEAEDHGGVLALLALPNTCSAPPDLWVLAIGARVVPGFL